MNRELTYFVSVIGVAAASCSGTGSSFDASSLKDGGGDSNVVAAATFSTVYSQVISAQCAPCHTTPTGVGVTGGKLDMTSRAAAYANLVDVNAASRECGGKGKRVVPGHPESSILYLKVSPSDPAPCGSKMPLDRTALAQGDVDLIASWIRGGAIDDVNETQRRSR